MTQTDPQPTGPDSGSSKPLWILWLIAGALIFGCVASLGALLLLRRASGLPWLENLGPVTMATATAPATETATAYIPATATSPPATPTPTQEATPTATRVVPPTATASPTASATTAQSATATQTTIATATQTATATRTSTATPAPTSAVTPRASPTPFVCDSLYELANIQLVPGQAFRCTVQEGELTDLANRYPDSPCSEAQFTLDDGEIEMECRIGIRMRAVLKAEVADCRMALEIVKGTPGFTQIVQELITTQFNVIQYDTICIDQVDVDDGQVTVVGYGR